MLDSMITTEITLTIFLLCLAASVLLGIAAAFVMTRGTHSTQSFCIMIAVLPLAVQTVIMSTALLERALPLQARSGL